MERDNRGYRKQCEHVLLLLISLVFIITYHSENLVQCATITDIQQDRKLCFGFPSLWITTLGHPENITMGLTCDNPDKVISVTRASYMRPGETGDNCMYKTSCCTFVSSSECRADINAMYPHIFNDIQSQCNGKQNCDLRLKSVEMDNVCGEFTCDSKRSFNSPTEKKYDYWCWARKVEVSYKCVQAPSTTTTSTTLPTTTTTEAPIIPSTKPTSLPETTRRTSTPVISTTLPTTTLKTSPETTTKATTTVKSIPVIVTSPKTIKIDDNDSVDNKTPDNVLPVANKTQDKNSGMIPPGFRSSTIVTVLAKTTEGSYHGVNNNNNNDLNSGNTLNPGYGVADFEIEPTSPQKKNNNIKFISWVAGGSLVALIAICTATVVIHILLRRSANKLKRNSSLKQKPRDNSAVILQNQSNNTAIMNTLTLYKNRHNSTGSKDIYPQDPQNQYLAATLPVTRDFRNYNLANQMTEDSLQLANQNNDNCDMVDNTYYEAEDVVDPRINNSFEHPRPDTDLIISKYKIQRPVIPKVSENIPTVSNQILNDFRIAPPPPPMNHPSVTRRQEMKAPVIANHEVVVPIPSDPLYYELCEDASIPNQGKFHINGNQPDINLLSSAPPHGNINHSVINNDDDYESTSDDIYESSNNEDLRRLHAHTNIVPHIDTHEYSGDDDDYYESSDEDEYHSGRSKPIPRSLTNKHSALNSKKTNDKSSDYDYAYDHFQFEGRQRSK